MLGRSATFKTLASFSNITDPSFKMCNMNTLNTTRHSFRHPKHVWVHVGLFFNSHEKQKNKIMYCVFVYSVIKQVEHSFGWRVHRSSHSRKRDGKLVCSLMKDLNSLIKAWDILFVSTDSCSPADGYAAPFILQLRVQVDLAYVYARQPHSTMADSYLAK